MHSPPFEFYGDTLDFGEEEVRRGVRNSSLNSADKMQAFLVY